MGPSPRIGVAELKKRQHLEKGAECVECASGEMRMGVHAPCKRCRWDQGVSARRLLTEMCSNKSAGGATVDVLLLFCKM